MVSRNAPLFSPESRRRACSLFHHRPAHFPIGPAPFEKALLAEQIKAAGTRFLFTNPGSVEVAFFDALTDRPELQIIMGLHEGVVLSMADGYHKVSGEPAFVNVHAVAGTGQIGGQMFNVHRDGSRIFITAGLSDITKFSDDLQLAPSAGFNQIDINQQFTKMSWEVRNGASCAIAARRAYKLTSTAPGGPVYIGYSRDALAERVSGEIWPKESFMIDARPRPAADKLEALARMLVEADRPAIIFGDEVSIHRPRASRPSLPVRKPRLDRADGRARSGRHTDSRSHPHGAAIRRRRHGYGDDGADASR